MKDNDVISIPNYGMVMVLKMSEDSKYPYLIAIQVNNHPFMFQNVQGQVHAHAVEGENTTWYLNPLAITAMEIAHVGYLTPVDTIKPYAGESLRADSRIAQSAWSALQVLLQRKAR